MGLKADVSRASTRSLRRPQGSRDLPCAPQTQPAPLRLLSPGHPQSLQELFKLALFLSNTMKSRAVRLPPPWLRPAAACEACEPLSSPQATTLPSALQCSRAQHLILLFVSRVITSLCLIYHLGHHRCVGTGDTAHVCLELSAVPSAHGGLRMCPSR